MSKKYQFNDGKVKTRLRDNSFLMLTTILFSQLKLVIWNRPRDLFLHKFIYFPNKYKTPIAKSVLINCYMSNTFIVFRCVRYRDVRNIQKVKRLQIRALLQKRFFMNGFTPHPLLKCWISIWPSRASYCYTVRFSMEDYFNWYMTLHWAQSENSVQQKSWKIYCNSNLNVLFWRATA